MNKRLREKPKHLKAFEIYYNLGEGRSIEKLRNVLIQSGELNPVPSRKTLEKWSADFKWREKIKQRDEEIKKEMQRQQKELLLNTKLDYRKDIKQVINIIKAILSKMLVKDEEGRIVDIAIDLNMDVKDFTRLVQVQDQLIKTDLALMGENIEEKTLRIEIVKVESKYEALHD